MKILLIASIMLLMTNFCANGQKGTDSILVPKHWLREGMKDLLRYDQSKEENKLLKESNENLRQLYQKTETFNKDLQAQKTALNFRWQECMKTTEIVEQNNRQALEMLNKQLKKERRINSFKTIGGVTVGIGVGVLAGFLFL